MYSTQNLKNILITAFSPTCSPRFFAENEVKMTFDLSTHFERANFELLKKQKTSEIGQSKLKL